MHVLSRFYTSRFSARPCTQLKYRLGVFVGILVLTVFAIYTYRNEHVQNSFSAIDTTSTIDTTPASSMFVMGPVSEIGSYIEPIVRVGRGNPHVLFGWSVAFSDDTVVVGSPSTLGAHNFQDGAVYIFTRLPNDLWRDQVLQVPDVLTEDHDLYGYSVAIHDHAIVVGAKGSARAYVYARRADGTWSDEPVAEFGQRGDYNNGSVAISADTIVVGTYGGAYVYQRNGKRWNMVPAAKLTVAPGGVADVKVAISGDTIVISNPDAGGDGRGIVQLHMRNKGIWPEKPTQTIIGPSSNSAFGSELGLQQSSLAVSSYDGTVNLYKRTDEGWAEENIRLNPPLQDDAFFGRSLCLSDNILVVGTMHYEKLRGTVYIYEHGKDDWHLSPSKTLVSPDQTSSFGHVVACDSRFIVIGEPNGKNNRGSIYIYEY